MADPVQLYLKDIKDIPLLSPEEELKLARRIRRGDSVARKKMISANLRLVISIAKRYTRFGLPFEDLIEEGNLGLMRAVKKFNPNMGYRFSTYAAWWIKQFVLRSIANQGKTIRIPVHMVDTISRYRKITERLSQKLGRKPTPSEISKAMKIPVKKVGIISELTAQTASLDAPVDEEGTAKFIDLIESTGATSSRDELSSLLTHEKVADLLEHIAPREKAILTLRYGLGGGTPMTLGDAAKQLNLTRERVRQIQNSAEKKLHAYLQTQERLLDESKEEEIR